MFVLLWFCLLCCLGFGFVFCRYKSLQIPGVIWFKLDSVTKQTVLFRFSNSHNVTVQFTVSTGKSKQLL